jgi:hypothetical protein
MAEENKGSSVAAMKAMFEAQIQKTTAPAQPAPKKLQPSGVFGAQATTTTT